MRSGRPHFDGVVRPSDRCFTCCVTHGARDRGPSPRCRRVHSRVRCAAHGCTPHADRRITLPGVSSSMGFKLTRERGGTEFSRSYGRVSRAGLLTREVVRKCGFDQRGQAAFTAPPWVASWTAHRYQLTRPGSGARPERQSIATSVVVPIRCDGVELSLATKPAERRIRRAVPISESTSTMAVTEIRWRWVSARRTDLRQPGF
jgi:hypothetical protein